MENAWGEELACSGCKHCHVLNDWCKFMGIHVDPTDDGCRNYEGRTA